MSYGPYRQEDDAFWEYRNDWNRQYFSWDHPFMEQMYALGSMFGKGPTHRPQTADSVPEFLHQVKTVFLPGKTLEWLKGFFSFLANVRFHSWQVFHGPGNVGSVQGSTRTNIELAIPLIESEIGSRELAVQTSAASAVQTRWRGKYYAPSGAGGQQAVGRLHAKYGSMEDEAGEEEKEDSTDAIAAELSNLGFQLLAYDSSSANHVSLEQTKARMRALIALLEGSLGSEHEGVSSSKASKHT